MKVLKFGGTSVADAKSINRVIDIILRKQKKDESIVVVVSAFGGVTNELVKIHDLASKGGTKGKTKTKAKYRQFLGKLLKRHDETILKLVKKTSQKKVLEGVNKKHLELEKILDKVYKSKKHELQSLDTVMSYGEQLSAYIISEAVKSKGADCQFVDARKLIKTDASFGKANVDTKKSYILIKRYFKKNYPLSIMGGFIASTNRGVTTTLGRGGSDYTASLIGAALGASVIEIWTDVDGFMTADPKKTKNALFIPKISYEKARDMACMGAKVIYFRAIYPAQVSNISIYIKNTFNPKATGTKIGN